MCKLGGDSEVTRLALRAGIDMLLVCHEGDRRTTVHAAARDMIEQGKLDDVSLKTCFTRIAARQKTL